VGAAGESHGFIHLPMHGQIKLAASGASQGALGLLSGFSGVFGRGHDDDLPRVSS
jgi:hypothetical protein